jgi:hypothetical protein
MVIALSFAFIVIQSPVFSMFVEIIENHFESTNIYGEVFIVIRSLQHA